MAKIEAKKALYIKLGRGGEREPRCLKDGTLRLGYDDVPHKLALSRDPDRLKQFFLDQGNAPGVATDHARQILEFYNIELDTLWITFADGLLRWCFARPEIEDLNDQGLDSLEFGSKLRQTVDGWHDKSIGGRLLRMSDLNGRLTAVSAYRKTICQVKPFDYLLRQINDEELPEITAANEAKSSLLECIRSIMKLLTWQDFELLIELIFSQSGWRRIGEVGGTQKTVDLELMLPSTGERAFVQVKSRTDQSQFEDYVHRFSQRPESKMFYVYHSGPESLMNEDTRIIVIGAERLSEMVLEAGLTDWLLDKAA